MERIIHDLYVSQVRSIRLKCGKTAECFNSFLSRFPSHIPCHFVVASKGNQRTVLLHYFFQSTRQLSDIHFCSICTHLSIYTVHWDEFIRVSSATVEAIWFSFFELFPMSPLVNPLLLYVLKTTLFLTTSTTSLSATAQLLNWLQTIFSFCATRLCHAIFYQRSLKFTKVIRSNYWENGPGFRIQCIVLNGPKHIWHYTCMPL